MSNEHRSLARHVAHVLAAGVLLASGGFVLAIDLDLPAQIGIRVIDENRHPLPGATVTWRLAGANEDDGSCEQTTGEDGTVTFTSYRPKTAIAFGLDWHCRVTVALEGFMPRSRSLACFPDARIDQEIVLQPRKTTVVRVRGPDGEPLPDLPLTLPEWVVVRTDSHGEYVYEHPPQEDGFEVWIRGRPCRIEDGPIAEIRLAKGDLPAARLVGKLLVEGRPAEGWFLAKGSRYLMTCSGGHGWWRMDGYRAEELVSIGPSGDFAMRYPEDHIIFVSPQGVPVLYPLDPMAWPEGERRVTVHIPPVRRVHEGRLLYGEGKPADRVRIVPGNVRSHDRQLSLSMGVSWQTLSQARTADGVSAGAFRTDPHGRYRLPVYFGARVGFGVPWGVGVTSDSLLAADEILLRPLRTRKERPKAPKRISLTFCNEKRESIRELYSVKCEEYAGADSMSSSNRAFADARGVHLFVDPKIDRVEIQAESRSWNPICRSIRTPGSIDWTVRVPVPEAFRRRPLAGTVLDPEGKPVEGVVVRAYDMERRLGSRHSETKTNARGRFHFDVAPDECSIRLSRRGAEGTWTLPGWVEPLVVKGEDRDITIRLRRAGAIRVLLPKGPIPSANQLWLDGPGGGRRPPYPSADHVSYVFMRDAELPGALIAKPVVPGWHVLRSHPPPGESRIHAAVIGSSWRSRRGRQPPSISARARYSHPAERLPSGRTSMSLPMGSPCPEPRCGSSPERSRATSRSPSG